MYSDTVEITRFTSDKRGEFSRKYSFDPVKQVLTIEISDLILSWSVNEDRLQIAVNAGLLTGDAEIILDNIVVDVKKLPTCVSYIPSMEDVADDGAQLPKNWRYARAMTAPQCTNPVYAKGELSCDCKYPGVMNMPNCPEFKGSEPTVLQTAYRGDEQVVVLSQKYVGSRIPVYNVTDDDTVHLDLTDAISSFNDRVEAEETELNIVHASTDHKRYISAVVG